MKKVLIILGAVIVAAIFFVSWYINGLNKIVRLNEIISQAWGEVNNQLQRRSDLIPNLVNTVKGYATHEKEIFENIAAARAKLSGATTKEDTIAANNDMRSALSRLLVVVENYPNLKADTNFQTLMAQLEGTENRLTVARMRYNEAVQSFNTYAKAVIGSFFARRKGLEKGFPYFEVAESAKATPVVKFD